jgi:hypothetical protein
MARYLTASADVVAGVVEAGLAAVALERTGAAALPPPVCATSTTTMLKHANAVITILLATLFGILIARE